jgi:replication factor C small subunit
MVGFECPVEGCGEELSKLQVMHFRANHDCDPVEWVEEQHGDRIRERYSSGDGSYSVANEYEWLSRTLVLEVVDTRSHSESLTGENNPMKREDIVVEFTGEDNPAKQESVRERISDAVTGHTLSEEAKQAISRKNTENEISEEHRQAVSEAASKMDRSYMQTEEYSAALSAALTGREPTHPTPYEVDELPHLVRSSWEEEIAKLLQKHGIEYQYEGRFELQCGSYYPDFVSGSFVIEVKGWATDRSETNAEGFMDGYPSYTYIVVGDELPCDIHIPWERRHELVEVLENE